MKIKQSLLQFVNPANTKEQKLKAAQGPQGLSPDDLVTVLFVLSHDKDPEVSDMARRSFEAMPVTEIISALEKKLDANVMARILSIHMQSEAVQIMAALNPGVDEKIIRNLAENGSEEVVEMILEDKERFKKDPLLIESLRKNPHAQLTSIARIEDFLAGKPVTDIEPQVKLGNEEKEAQDPDAPVDEELKKKAVIENDEHNMLKLVQGLSVAKKIKLALMGNKAARELLSKESNKIVALSVLKNPRITEDEVMRIAGSKGTSDDLLRTIARNKEWVKNYSIKLTMVNNSKTPVAVSLKFLDHLIAQDLVKISRSKNIPSAIASAARRKLESKKH